MLQTLFSCFSVLSYKCTFSCITTWLNGWEVGKKPSILHLSGQFHLVSLDWRQIPTLLGKLLSCMGLKRWQHECSSLGGEGWLKACISSRAKYSWELRKNTKYFKCLNFAISLESVPDLVVALMQKNWRLEVIFQGCLLSVGWATAGAFTSLHFAPQNPAIICNSAASPSR